MITTPNLVRFICKIKTKSGVVVEHLSMPALSQEEAVSNLKKIYYKCEVLDITQSQEHPTEEVAYADVLSLIVND